MLLFQRRLNILLENILQSTCLTVWDEIFAIFTIFREIAEISSRK